MKKGGIILLIIFVPVLIIFIWKSFGVYDVKRQESNNDGIEQVDLVQLERQYRAEIKKLMPEYQNVVENAETGKAASLREKILALKMPKEYRNLHAKLVLLLDSIEDGQDMAEVNKVFNDLIQSNSWLGQ